TSGCHSDSRTYQHRRQRSLQDMNNVRPISLVIVRRAPISTLFPYTTLFRSLMHRGPVHGPFLSQGKLFGKERLPMKQEYTQSAGDRKSTRLNSSHVSISYAVFCLKKKNNQVELR